MKVLVFGSLNIDNVYQLEHFVRPGETTDSVYTRNKGGKGFNQAVALKKAGLDVSFAGAIGADGVFLKEYLDSVGIDTCDIDIVDVPTGHAVIQVNTQGENCIILYGGANRAITEGMAERVLSHCEKGDVVVLQNEISMVDAIISRAKERGLTVVLNPSPVTPSILAAPIGMADYLILNETEGAALSGKTEPGEIVDALTAMYPDTYIVLTLGELGSVYGFGETRIRQAAYKADAVDTTAAGDTFTGYFMAGVLAGREPGEALDSASRASAVTVSRPGAAESIPYACELDK